MLRSWWPPEAGRLAGFHYREIARKLKAFGFQFDRQAAGSHEIWYNPAANRYTTIPNHPGDMPEGTLRAILKQAAIDPEAFLAA
ncbi:MAG: type II toxin-antitoxin system HicA family toxin [Bryobacteraceae bacterium]